MALIIFLDDRRRRIANWITKLQHVVAGVPLLFIGLHKLVSDEAERPMALLEVAIATGVFAAFALEWRAERRHLAGNAKTAAHAHLGWFDLAAGALLIFEALHGNHTKPVYLRASFFSGVVAIGIGLFHGRFQGFLRRRRYIKLDDAGFEFRFAPLRRLTLRWVELASIDLSEASVVFHRTDGRRRSIRLKWFTNAQAVRRAIADHPASAALLEEPRLR